MRYLYLETVFVVAYAVFAADTGVKATTSCADRVSTGDQSVGISAVADASCISGGLGCFPFGDQCRFCRESEHSQAMHLELCSEIEVLTPPSTESTGKTDFVTSSTEQSTAQQTESMTKTPASPEQSPACQTESTTNTSISSKEEALDCLSLVSVGDQRVGISAVAATYPTCAASGLGCFRSGQCRFCQTRSTPQSTAFLTCSSLGGSSTPTPNLSPTTPPSSTPTPTVASTSTTCSSVVLRSGLEGISFVLEGRCNVAAPTLLGCSARTSCRLCRNNKNEANQYLISCNVLKAQGTTESAVDPTTRVDSAGNPTVYTETQSAPQKALSGSPAVSLLAAAALVVVAIMSALYVKKRRESCEEPSTPDNCPDCDVFTPHGGHGYMSRQGSLVQVQSQSSIATL
ncbi:hypothetical protein Plhal304r1_c005g0019151 [Plasmopara halstedii]